MQSVTYHIRRHCHRRHCLVWKCYKGYMSYASQSCCYHKTRWGTSNLPDAGHPHAHHHLQKPRQGCMFNLRDTGRLGTTPSINHYGETASSGDQHSDSLIGSTLFHLLCIED